MTENAASTTEKPARGLLIYALANSQDDWNIPDWRGVGGEPVSALTEGSVTAFVSPVRKPKIRPERRNLAAHMQILKQLMEVRTILPFKFGTVAENEASLRSLIKRNQEDFVEELAAVAGKVEMSIRVVWDVSNVFEYFVGLRTELRSARDAVGDIRTAVREDKIDLGRMFDVALNEERDRLYEQVAEVLERYEIRHVRGPARNERVVMDLACLVKREELDQFDRVVSEAASGFDANFTFKVSGSWPPVSFVELNLSLDA
ncbi:MAG: GvpL/GvpF family gas vesicle protein [Litorivicinus sp.]